MTKIYHFEPLNFTAEEANSTIKLKKDGAYLTASLESSTDGVNWTPYTIDDVITLTNIGDRIYFRNTSETDVEEFSVNTSNYFRFVMTGKIAGNGDVTSLLNKNGTNTLSNYCFTYLFFNAQSLTKAPKLPATTLALGCYFRMFWWCFNLTKIPTLPATILAQECYYQMFRGCTQIKLSTTQDSDYTQEYRIPTTGTGITANNALTDMFIDTTGTFTGTPSINTTYYTSNTLV